MEFASIYANSRQRDYRARARKAREYARAVFFLLVMCCITAVFMDEDYGPVAQAQVQAWFAEFESFRAKLTGA